MAVKEITVDLDKPRQLRLNFTELSRADTEIRLTNPAGVGLVKCMLTVADGDFNFEALRIAYYHALRGADKDINPISAGRIIDEALDREDVGFGDLAMNILRLLQAMGVIDFKIEDEEEEATGESADRPIVSAVAAET